MQVTPRPLTAETRCCGISNRAILPTVSERRLPLSGLTRLRQLSGIPRKQAPARASGAAQQRWGVTLCAAGPKAARRCAGAARYVQRQAGKEGSSRCESA